MTPTTLQKRRLHRQRRLIGTTHIAGNHEPRTGRRHLADIEADTTHEYGTPSDPLAYVTGRVLQRLKHAVLDAQVDALAWELLHDLDGPDACSCDFCLRWRRRNVREISSFFRQIQAKAGIVPKASPSVDQSNIYEHEDGPPIEAQLLDILADALLQESTRTPFEPGRNLVGYVLPHHAEEPSSDYCGSTIILGHHAGSQAHIHPVRRDCAAYDCPECRSEKKTDGSWDLRGYEKRAGLAILDRFQAAWDTHGLKKQDQPVHHIAISPPQAWARALLATGDAGRKRLNKAAVRIAKNRGVTGGCIIYHGQRVPGRYGDRRCPVDGPHYHTLGWSRLGARYDGHACRDGFHRDGWIVKFIDATNAPKRNIPFTAAYVLSHASRPEYANATLEMFHPTGRHGPADPDHPERGAATAVPYPALERASELQEGRSKGVRSPTQVVRWFGTLAYNQLQVPKPEPPTDRKCPVCAERVPLEDWFEIKFATGGFIPPPGGAIADSSDLRFISLPQPRRRRDPDHSEPDPDSLVRPGAAGGDLSGRALFGTWLDGQFHTHDAPACPCCTIQAVLEPETVHRTLTGSGLLQCAACGIIRAHRDDLVATDFPLPLYEATP